MTIEYIKETLEFKCGYRFDDNSRNRTKVYLRCLYYVLCREYTTKSLEEIAALVNRDHSTAVYGIKLFEQAFVYEEYIVDLYNEFVKEHPNKPSKIKMANVDTIKALNEKIEQLQIENTRLMLELEQARRYDTIEA